MSWGPDNLSAVTSLRPLPVAPGRSAVDALPALRQALEGGPAVLPHASVSPPPPVPAGAEVEEGTALVVGTSGSTGTPKLAMLSAAALRASADATHERLGGPGSWLLAMPPHHIAGIQVLLRCVAAGTHPQFVDLSGGFTPAAFVAAASAALPTSRNPSARRYTSLVPTQLLRLLGDAPATEALSHFDGVLVGGAATSPGLLARAHDSGVHVVTSYGMSETCGGCVYDGTPLSGTRIRSDADSRLYLGGRSLATGYLGRPDLTAVAFGTDPSGQRWFRTDDSGHRGDDGRWHVDGRLDDLITTGGLKVAPRLVEEAITQTLHEVAEAVVVGTPDPEWGQAVAAAVVLRPGARPPTVADLRSRLYGILPDHARPRRLMVLEALPLRGPGKPDRGQVAGFFATQP